MHHLRRHLAHRTPLRLDEHIGPPIIRRARHQEFANASLRIIPLQQGTMLMMAHPFKNGFRRGPQADDQGMRLKLFQVILVRGQAAAGGNDQSRAGRQFPQDRLFQLPKRRLALVAENFGNGHAGFGFNQCVRIHKSEIQLGGHGLADNGFARAHEADEGQVTDMPCGVHRDLITATRRLWHAVFRRDDWSVSPNRRCQSPVDQPGFDGPFANCQFGHTARGRRSASDMRTFLVRLLMVLALGLCGLVAVQWQREVRLRRAVQELHRVVEEQRGKMQRLDGALQRAEEEILRREDATRQLTEAQETNRTNSVRREKELEQARADAQHQARQAAVYQEALAQANTNLQQQNQIIRQQQETLQQLTEERDDIARRYNQTVTEFHALVQQWNELQARRGNLRTNAPIRP